jgi:hypothetical protein
VSLDVRNTRLDLTIQCWLDTQVHVSVLRPVLEPTVGV